MTDLEYVLSARVYSISIMISMQIWIGLFIIWINFNADMDWAVDNMDQYNYNEFNADIDSAL